MYMVHVLRYRVGVMQRYFSLQKKAILFEQHRYLSSSFYVFFFVCFCILFSLRQ